MIKLDIMDQEQMIANNVEDKVESKLNQWSIPIVRKTGHMYIRWTNYNSLFTRQELLRMHRDLYHPSTHKLLALIRWSNLKHADKHTRNMLEEISQSCSNCQIISQKVQRCKVSMTNVKIIFNRKLALDLIWLDRKAALYIVDIDTHFNSAQFLNTQTVEHVWEAFLSCWTTMFIGNPLKIRVDQCSVFTSIHFTLLCDTAGIEVKDYGIEHRNALGSSEPYHDPLQRIFGKVKQEHHALNQ